MFPLFTNFALLAGLGAIAAPLLIHLLLKRKSQRMKFSTIQFFLKQDEQSMRRRKLRNLLLLATRVLLFALLVLAFARPYLPNGGAGANGATRRQLVILLDTSASMQANTPGGSQWARAIDQVRQELGKLQMDDRAALVTCSTRADLVSEFSAASAVLKKLEGVQGSSPQKRGAKALFFADGRIVGTLGGGCLEAEVRRRALEALKTGRPEKFDLLLDHDFGWDDGLICGGKVYGLILPNAAQHLEIWKALARRDEIRTWGITDNFDADWVAAADRRQWIYRETVSPPCALWIAGSGHIARAVAPLAQQLDFEVTVFDDRPALASTQFYPAETILRVDYWPALLKDELPSRPTLGLIVTRGHQHDALVLKEWIHKPFAFLGMIGSKRKKRIIFSHFAEEGIASNDQLANVACPVGIDIDAVSVSEIAVSIVAQLVQKRAEIMGTAKRRLSRSAEPEACVVGK